MKYSYEKNESLTVKGSFGTAVLSPGDETNLLVCKGSSEDCRWLIRALVLELNSKTMVVRCGNEVRERILAYEDIVEVSDKCPM